MKFLFSSDNRVLATFALTALAAIGIACVYFTGLHRRLQTRWIKACAVNAVLTLVLLTAGLLLGELYFRYVLDTSDSF